MHMLKSCICDRECWFYNDKFLLKVVYLRQYSVRPRMLCYMLEQSLQNRNQIHHSIINIQLNIKYIYVTSRFIFVSTWDIPQDPPSARVATQII